MSSDAFPRPTSPSASSESDTSGGPSTPPPPPACDDDRKLPASAALQLDATAAHLAAPSSFSAFDLLLSAASTMDDDDLPHSSQLATTTLAHSTTSFARASSSTAAGPAQAVLPFPPAPSSTHSASSAFSSSSSSSSSSSASSSKKKMRVVPPPAPASSSGVDETLRPEDLTSKGKKRKRLAKACRSACHKNKRRCSGDSPCANCEFSGRECVYLSSTGQRVSAPRSSRLSPDGSASDGASSSAVFPATAGTGPVTASSSSSSSNGRKRPKSVAVVPNDSPALVNVVQQDLKPNPLSMGQSGLSDSFYAVHSSVLAASASSTVSAVDMGGPSSRSTSSPALSGGSAQTLSWDAGGASTSMMAATSAVRGQQDRQSSFASSSIPSSIGREVDVDPLLKRSLVKSFFEHFAEPLSSIFHKPTFFASLYEDRTTPLLLHAIYAWSARFSSHPSLVELSPERMLRGEAFADKVRREVESPGWVDEVLCGSERVGKEEEIERAQALVLMTVYESLLRRGTKTLRYLDILVPFVTRLTQQDNPPPPPNDLPPSRSDTTERELRSRLFWTTYVFSASLEAQSGRSLSARAPKGFTAQDCRLALPVSDDRFEMGACREGLRSDGLTHPEGGASRMLISELGHLARVQRIFRDIMSSASGASVTQSPRMGSQSVDHEASLKIWAQTLPSGLQFNEINLKAAVDRIHHRPVGDGALSEESIGPGGDSGHAFAVLHTAAEVAMFFQLQTVRTTRPMEPGQDQYLARRQSQAVENIVFVLNAVGEKGRQNPCLFFPLYIVSKWKASSSQRGADPNVVSWWNETGLLWGFDLDVILDRGFIDITPHSSPPSDFRPLPTRTTTDVSMASSSASSSTVPPSSAYSTALPSPQLEQVVSFDHRLPSITTLHPTSQSMTGISLPSPSTFTSSQLPLLSSSTVPSLPSLRRGSISDSKTLPPFPLSASLSVSPAQRFALPPSSFIRPRSVSNASSSHTMSGPSI